jgi:hypothetical protein
MPKDNIVRYELDYEAERVQINIDTNFSEQLTVNAKPILVVQDALVFMERGQEIFRLSAEYDLSTIHPKYLNFALECVLNNRQRVFLNL